MKMEHRIRSSAIVVKENAMLLVNHKNKISGAEIWIPPGGGLQEGEDIFSCATRETFEETGLNVTLGKILYLREFVESESNRYHFEIFILAESFGGEVAVENAEPSNQSYYIKEAKFCSPKEMRKLNVKPEILKGEFWKDYASGHFEMKYLGQQVG
jgi:ADP-ribose pyrophosphatase YjhB (NUDIX family)